MNAIDWDRISRLIADDISFGPGCFSTCPTATSTQNITAESIRQAIEQARSLPRPEHDVLVCTPGVVRSIRKEMLSRVSPDLIHDRIYGMPVYVGSTEAEVDRIAADLVREGKKVLVVKE